MIEDHGVGVLANWAASECIQDLVGLSLELQEALKNC